MKELANIMLNLANLNKVTYGEIRLIEEIEESISVKNGVVEKIEVNKEKGFGIRILKNGGWGFASSSKIEKNEIEKITNFALLLANASALVKKKEIKLSSVKPICVNYKNKIVKDPFEVSLNKKIDLLLEADKIIRTTSQKIKIREAKMCFNKTIKFFANTEGSLIQQEVIVSGACLQATAMSDGELQRRSYPGFEGNYATLGFEFIEEMCLEKGASQIAEEATQLLKAKLCPSQKTTLILGTNQLALQIHESCGHPVELDRVLGDELSFAGTSFLTLDKLNHFQYGSSIVNINADATINGGLGTFGYDDEGVPAQKFPIIKNGQFVGYLSSRETSQYVNTISSGAMRSSGWNRIPLIRMTNLNLEPDKWELDELIAETKEGIFMETTKSWSIDDKRLNFQFGCEIAWKIKNGKKTNLLKNPTYTGITPIFWNSCDAICNQNHFKLWGIPNCGKGEPMQIMMVGHGASPSRFRNIKVGLIKC